MLIVYQCLLSFAATTVAFAIIAVYMDRKNRS